MFCLDMFLKTKYIFLALGMWESSSVVEHSNVDREVSSSIPLAPFSIILGYLSKDFRCFKYINCDLPWEKVR